MPFNIDRFLFKADSGKKKHHLKVTFLLCFIFCCSLILNLIATTDTPCLFFAFLIALSCRLFLFSSCGIKSNRGPTRNLSSGETLRETAIRRSDFGLGNIGFYLAEKATRKMLKTHENIGEESPAPPPKIPEIFSIKFQWNSRTTKARRWCVWKSLFWCSLVDHSKAIEAGASVYVKRYQ